MSKPQPSLKPDRRGARARLLGVCLAMLVGVGVWSFPPFCNLLPDLSYDLAFAFRSGQQPEDVIIVGMDDLFHQQHETRESQRQAHARLTRRLQESQARLLVFDVGFSQEARDPEVDRDLARAFRDFGSKRVFVADKLEMTDLHATPVTRVIATWHTPTIEVLRDVVTEGAALRSAGTVRRFHPEDEVSPHQPLMVELAAQAKIPSGQSLINFYGREGTIARVSYGDVLDQTNLDPRTFAGKAVFVGQGRLNSKVGEAAPVDIHPVPFTLGGSMSGVEIQATAYVNLLRREAVQEAAPLVNLLFLLAMGSLPAWYAFHRRPAVIFLGVLLASIGVSLLGIALQLEGRILIPWLIPAAIQIPLTGLWSWAVGGTIPHPMPAAAAAVPTAEPKDAATQNAAVQPEPPVLTAGAIIADHELVKRIDAGSYGEVWLARNPIGQLRAIKTVTQRAETDPVILEREFHGIQRFMPISFNHPGLVQIFHLGLGRGGNSFYYVLELADPLDPGPQPNPETYQPRTLRHEIRRHGRLPLSDCVKWGVALAEALGFLHEQGLVHRDIKPSNLIFVGGRLKLADIGCVTNQGEQASYIGTEGYLAPEGPGRPTADIFSLGMVLYEMATGLRPSQFPETPSLVLEGPDAELWLDYNDILIRCCEEVPSDRFQTAHEVSEALSELIPAS